MNNELFFLIEKHTITLIEETKTNPHQTPDFKMSKQMESFPFNPPINLYEDGKWLLAESFVKQRTSFSRQPMRTIVFQLLY